MSTQVRSISRLHPNPTDNVHPKTVHLSILDSSVANFAAGAAVWMYDGPETSSDKPVVKQLTKSLQLTLNAYPQWTGQLKFVDYDPQKPDPGHSGRFHRVVLTYGEPDEDPGVHFVVAHNTSSLAQHIPPFHSRPREWEADHILSMGLLPSSPKLALHDLETWEGLPCMMVQITTFACGAIVLGLKMAHPLADAQTLTTFMKDWAAVHRASRSGAPIPIPNPVFKPELIDEVASGDIDAPEPDVHLIEASRALPVNRFDWWSSSEDCPPFLKHVTQVPQALADKPIERGAVMPWSEWDLGALVKYYLIHFSADEIESLWEICKSFPGAEGISKFDALQAHIWALIIRARGTGQRETMNLNITLGVRERCKPPLPNNFLGSPIFLARVSASSTDSERGSLAKRIRETLKVFSASAIGSLLHGMAHEACLHRIWGAFLGKRNCIVTSWLRLGVYDIHFGFGKPRLVEGVMPSLDGCLQFMESGPVVENDQRWYGSGVTVSLHLEAGVMEAVLRDSMFRDFGR